MLPITCDRLANNIFSKSLHFFVGGRGDAVGSVWSDYRGLQVGCQVANAQ